MSNLTQTETITLQCELAPRLGALDRVLGVLSHQGILPLEMHAVQEDDRLRVSFKLPACEPDLMAKRVKLIEKQIDVVRCEVISEDNKVQ